MNRNIKFRGLTEAGEWVYGRYIRHSPTTPSPIGGKELPYKHFIACSGFSDWNMPRPIDLVPVQEDSVGQFTGFCDKNDQEVYEGDLLEHHAIAGKSYEVIWDSKGHGWAFACNGTICCYPDESTEIANDGKLTLGLVGNKHSK